MLIKSVVIIGSGTMGSGIAAHLCNANIPVTLLDLSTDISTKARERIYKSRPPLLIDKKKIDNIKVAIINPLKGICLLLNPKAATVPNITDPSVAKIAIIKLFFAAKPQGFLVP